MKDNKILNDIKDIIANSKEWAQLQLEYTKLTAAEKFTILGGAIVVGAICMLIGVVILFVVAVCLIDIFKMIMLPVLACLAAIGILLLLMAGILVFKKPLILDPIAKFLTKLFLQ